MKIAIVGSGISGLAVAHTLQGKAEITLIEADSYFGGHAHTVDVTLPTAQGEVIHGVDTGFLVFNERTYPNLIQLLGELEVDTFPSDMSFSVQVPGAKGTGALEWNGSSLSGVFAQRSNLFNLRFLGMLNDLLRFNKLTTHMALVNTAEVQEQTLDIFLKEHRFGEAFCNWYLLPMLGCIWSCPTDQMLRFPVATMVRFCYNHGLIQISQRPQWYTVVGGAKHYVEKIVRNIPQKRLNSPVLRIERDELGVRIITASGTEHFDQLVLATHSDQALRLLAEPTSKESAILGAIRYQPNRAILHTDSSMLPLQRRAWAAWNYERAGDDSRESSRVCLHYLINQLQPLPFSQPVIVSLNPIRTIANRHILGAYDYDHPIFDLEAISAQKDIPTLQGENRTWFCGAWTGYGFHEDGLKSGLAVAQQLLRLLNI